MFYVTRTLCTQDPISSEPYVPRALWSKCAMFSRPYLPIGLYSQGTVLQLLRMFLVHYIFTVLSGSYVIILMFPVFPIFPAPYTPRTLDLLRVLCSQGPVFLNPYVPKGRYFQDPIFSEPSEYSQDTMFSRLIRMFSGPEIFRVLS